MARLDSISSVSSIGGGPFLSDGGNEGLDLRSVPLVLFKTVFR